MKLYPMLVLLSFGALLGCCQSNPRTEEVETSKALFAKVDSIWINGGNHAELARIRGIIEGRIRHAGDADYALARAHLHSVPISIKHAENYLDFLAQVALATGVTLACDPKAKDRLLERQDVPFFDGVGSALDAITLLELFASTRRMGLIFALHPGQIVIVPAD